MANSLHHSSVGTSLTQAEYEAIDGHVIESQATGDILYAASASSLRRLGISGTATHFLGITGGVPAWKAVTVAGSDLTGTSLASGIVSSSLTSVGTIASGVWQGTDVGVAYGGTGASTLTANGVLIGNGTGAVTAVDQSTKGHILIGDGSGNPQMLAVGSNGQILTADSGETTGVKWATAGAAAAGSLTGATLASGVTASSLTSVGALGGGSITSGFGAIDIGSDNLTATGTISLGATNLNNNALTNVGSASGDWTSTRLNTGGQFLNVGSQTPQDRIAIDLRPAVTADNPYGFNLAPALTHSGTGTSMYPVVIGAGSTTTMNNSITYTLIPSVYINEPSITKGATDTITEATTLYIPSAPTEATSNYSLHVDAGDVRLDGKATIGDTAIPSSDNYRLTLHHLNAHCYLSFQHDSSPNYGVTGTDIGVLSSGIFAISQRESQSVRVDIGGATKFIIDGTTGDTSLENNDLLNVGGAANDWTSTKLTTNAIKITTGAGADKVLTSDANGDATWETAGGGGGVSTCRFMVTNSSTISCSDQTWTKATWNAEVFDVGGNFGSDRFTAPADGTYMFTASLSWTTMVAGADFAMGVYKNGSYNLTVENQSTEINISFMMSATWIMELEEDDYLELYAIQGSGYTESIGGSSPNWTGPTAANSNWWQGWLIG